MRTVAFMEVARVAQVALFVMALCASTGCGREPCCELLRKAALFAADESDGGGIVVEKRHLEEALAELLIGGGQLTQSLLGSRIKTAES